MYEIFKTEIFCIEIHTSLQTFKRKLFPKILHDTTAVLDQDKKNSLNEFPHIYISTSAMYEILKQKFSTWKFINFLKYLKEIFLRKYYMMPRDCWITEQDKKKLCIVLHINI